LPVKPCGGPNSGFAWAAGAPLPISSSKNFIDILPARTGTREIGTYRALVALDGDFSVANRDMYWSVSASHAGTDGEIRYWDIARARFDNAIDARADVNGKSPVTFNAGSIRFRGETYTVDYSLGNGSGWGRMDLNLEATHTALLETSVTGVDLTRTDGITANPKWRARFGARYSYGSLGVFYTLNFCRKCASLAKPRSRTRRM
jgi:hypothetical protein